MSTSGTLSAIDEYLDALLDHAPDVPAIGAIGNAANGAASVGEPARTAPPTPPPPSAPSPTTAASPANAPAAQTPATSPVRAAPAMSSSHRWLRVNVGSDSYAMELLCVQEVVRLTPIVAMRGVGRAVLGVMNLRGRIVPVFDLGLWLNAGCVHGDDRSRIVVVERNDELIGVVVSAVEDVITLGRDRIEPPLAGGDAGAILGIARVGAIPTVLLDTNALFG